MLIENSKSGGSANWFDLDSPLYADMFPDVAAAWRRGELTSDACATEAFRRLDQHIGTWVVDRVRRDDILQETLLRLRSGGADDYDRRVSAFRYVRAFARNIERELRRQGRRELRIDPEVMACTVRRCDGPSELAANQEFLTLVRALLRHLTPQQHWAVTKEHPILNEPNAVATCRSCNEYVDRHRGLRILRDLLEQLGWAKSHDALVGKRASSRASRNGAHRKLRDDAKHDPRT